MPHFKYRLALDLGSTSLGWALVRLNADSPPAPVAVIKAGSRIFSDGRNPKDGTSLAVTRREARAMRRRRDRLLKRKARMTRTLIEHGLFPSEEKSRKALENLNPYAIRAKGLDTALTPEEFARALFHINQRRGFKSNRKTDKKENDAGALKGAISKLRQDLITEKCRTVGEWLHKRDAAGQTVRARYRQRRVTREDGKTRIEKSYDLYIDRAMIETEFDTLWTRQSSLNPTVFNERARLELKDCLLHQRPLKPVKPGRCTLLPEEERAPSALPSQQRFRIYQEVNNLRILGEGLLEAPLDLAQRDLVVTALEHNGKRSFSQIRSLLGLGGAARFNLEDAKRQDLRGNATSAKLAQEGCFGATWFTFTEGKQDQILMQLAKEENETRLLHWLQTETGVDEVQAEAIANAALPEGYGSLSAKALALILPALKGNVLTYDKAVLAAGFDHHSAISHATTGEIMYELPYYGEYLSRHVGFGSGKLEDHAEKRFGKIANPTVHIGLNQIRVVVNALLKRYGHPSEVIVEVARDLKQNQEQRKEDADRQAKNQKRNERIRIEVAAILECSLERVRHADIQKMILWEELSFDAAERRCPYSGVQIGGQMLFSNQVEIEHILPFSQTLDDSLNNKTVAMRQANRIKGNRSPWEARVDFQAQGWSTDAILSRAEQMPKNKRYRFGEGGYQRWLREDKDFLARALNDTRYLSRVAREYLGLICPQATRVIPGQMTALLRAKFGLNDILGLNGEKNRNDHRHHAVDACVIAVTDQRMLQRFAIASASARVQQLDRLVEKMPLPWATYRTHVARAVHCLRVSHKPDHGYEGAMHEASAWGTLPDGRATRRIRGEDGKRQREVKNRTLITFSSTSDFERHGLEETGEPKAYKGYIGGSNFCLDIVCNDAGRWEAEIVSTFAAYQMVRSLGQDRALQRFKSAALAISGKPLVARLQNGDMVCMELDGRSVLMRIVKMTSNGQIFFAPHNEANVDARNTSKSDAFAYVSKYPGSLQKARGRRVTVSPIGELRDKGRNS